MFNHIEAGECLTFLNDSPRNSWYADILKDNVKDKIIFEIGSGVGILAAYALEYGAKFYYGIDVRRNRAAYATHILNQLGYQDRFNIQSGNFLNLKKYNIPQPVDVFLCERTTDQFWSGMNMRLFWQHANEIFPSTYTSIPDEWSMDVRVYAGALDSPLPEYQPRLLLPDPLLPAGFYQAIMSTNFVQPTEVHNKILSFTQKNCYAPVEFTLDLTSYVSATVVINDNITYRNDACLSISATRDWPHPIKIVIPDAKSKIKFFWNNTIKPTEKYENGFWDFIKIN